MLTIRSRRAKMKCRRPCRHYHNTQTIGGGEPSASDAIAAQRIARAPRVIEGSTPASRQSPFQLVFAAPPTKCRVAHVRRQTARSREHIHASASAEMPKITPISRRGLTHHLSRDALGFARREDHRRIATVPSSRAPSRYADALAADAVARLRRPTAARCFSLIFCRGSFSPSRRATSALMS